LSDIIGRDYEVNSPDGQLICVIRQKPMKLVQLNMLLKTLNKLREKEKKTLDKKAKKK